MWFLKIDYTNHIPQVICQIKTMDNQPLNTGENIAQVYFDDTNMHRRPWVAIHPLETFGIAKVEPDATAEEVCEFINRNLRWYHNAVIFESLTGSSSIKLISVINKFDLIFSGISGINRVNYFGIRTTYDGFIEIYEGILEYIPLQVFEEEFDRVRFGNYNFMYL